MEERINKIEEVIFRLQEARERDKQMIESNKQMIESNKQMIENQQKMLVRLEANQIVLNKEYKTEMKELREDLIRTTKQIRDSMNKFSKTVIEALVDIKDKLVNHEERIEKLEEQNTADGDILT